MQLVKKYKTVGNLEKVWTHIDNALSEINLAYEDLNEMMLDNEGVHSLGAELERFDETQLVSIKNHIEELLEAKGSQFFKMK